MLFLYRPRQTWMPYVLPRSRTEQGAYNRRLQDRFAATRRTPAAPPAEAPNTLAQLEALAELHRSGVVTDAEFDQVKGELLS